MSCRLVLYPHHGGIELFRREIIIFQELWQGVHCYDYSRCEDHTSMLIYWSAILILGPRILVLCS